MNINQRFNSPYLPYFFLAPQILIIVIFFLYPAAQAIMMSFMMEDPWGMSSNFVWFDNYIDVFHSSEYIRSIGFSLVYAFFVTALSLSLALFWAVKVDSILHGQSKYRVLLTWGYAVAPAVAGIIGAFLFNQHIGVISHFLKSLGWNFNAQTNAFDATFALIIATSWKQVSVNFIYFLAGLQSVSKAVSEAAMLDCESDTRRFWTITFPLLAPTGFFLLVINLTYAFFDSFGTIDTMTGGGPGGSTTSMVYKVFQDGFLGLDLGGSSAQSVILLLLVLGLTVIQFKFLEKKVHY